MNRWKMLNDAGVSAPSANPFDRGAEIRTLLRKTEETAGDADWDALVAKHEARLERDVHHLVVELRKVHSGRRRGPQEKRPRRRVRGRSWEGLS